MEITAHPVDSSGKIACFVPETVFNAVTAAEGESPSKVDASDDASHLIFLVDSSGSMSSVWPFVAEGINGIAVSRPNTHVLKWANAGAVRTKPLLTDLRQCAEVDERAGCGTGFGTNITEGAVTLRSHLKLLREKVSNFIVVFVSDGYGSTQGLELVLKDIRESVLAPHMTLEMTTIGILSQFPTSIAMKMRNILHNGRVGIPLCSIAESVDEFQEALAGLVEYISPRCIRLYLAQTAGARTAPWEDETKVAVPGVALLLPAGTSSLTLTLDRKGKKGLFQVPVLVSAWRQDNLSMMAKQFTWELQSASLHNTVSPEGLKERAASALCIVSYAIQQLEAATDKLKAKGSDASTSGNRLSVLARVMRKQERGTNHLLSAFRKELKNLSEGSQLDKLSDVELAQRLAIGTMEGKFHQRALAWKGLSDEEFKGRVEQFIKLLADEKKIEAVKCMIDFEETSGLRSAITFECNAEILTQGELSQALKEVPSQYFLVDILPLCGLALNIARTPASMINPWACKVIGMSPVSPVMDTTSLVSMGNDLALSGGGISAEMSTGDGEYDVVNTVCALVGNAEHAAAMRPFLTSRLYQVLHTYCASGNADTSDASSHAAMLAAVVCYFLNGQEYGGASEDWMDKSLLSLRELYPRRLGMMKGGYASSLKADCGRSVVTASPDIETSCECMSKPIAVALAWSDCMSGEYSERVAIVDRIAAEWVGRALGSQREVSDWFSLVEPNIELRVAGTETELTPEIVVNRMKRAGISSYFTTVDALKDVSSFTPTVSFESKHGGAAVNAAKLFSSGSDGAVSAHTITHFGRRFLSDPGWAMTDEDIFRYVFHGIKNPSSRGRMGDILSYEGTHSSVVKSLVQKSKHALISKLRVRIKEQVYNAWREAFAGTHAPGEVEPLPFSEITRLRAARGLEYLSEEELGYRRGVGLCSRACMAKKCPFFLERRGVDTSLHYSEAARGGKGPITAFSIAVSECVYKGVTNGAEILHAVKSGEYMQYPDEERRKRVVALVEENWVELLAMVKKLIPMYRNLKSSM